MDSDTESPSSRLQSELDLLHAMYPDGAVSYSPKGREFRYVHHNNQDSNDTISSNTKATLLLRLPDEYPLSGRPQVISATATTTTASTTTPQRDLRSEAADMIQSHYASNPATAIQEDEEVLDALILAFQELIEGVVVAVASAANDGEGKSAERDESNKRKTKTVVIWLHHLLNTNKRKLAVTPSSLVVVAEGGGGEKEDVQNNIHGVTKPGYPGVLVYTGPKEAVESHVAELKAQRWQGFQVKFDSEEYYGDDGSGGGSRRKWWGIVKDGGAARIREVESMSDVVQSIDGEEERGLFLSVMGIR